MVPVVALCLQFMLVACSGDQVSSLVTATDKEGKPKVVKLIKIGVLPAGSNELPGGREAAAVRAICMGSSKVCGLPRTLDTWCMHVLGHVNATLQLLTHTFHFYTSHHSPLRTKARLAVQRPLTDRRPVCTHAACWRGHCGG